LKFPFSIFLLMVSFEAYAQNAFFIRYTRPGEFVLPITINGMEQRIKHKGFYNIAFNDSVCFTFYTETKNEQWKKYCKQGASKVKPHSSFYKRSSNEIFNGVSYPDTREPFFILDSLPGKEIYIDSTIKKLKDWRCKEAYAVVNPGDTIFAFLAIDYPYPYGPMNCACFPYLVLELFRPKYDYELLIDKFEEGDFEICIPSGIPVITRQEWKKKNPQEK